MKGGFFFKINQDQIDNWRKDYRCPPDESGLDCGANVLSFLGIPYNIARELQTLSNQQGALSLQQLVEALNLLPKDEFENAPNLEDVTSYDYENIDDMFAFLFDNLPPKYAVIVLGVRKEALFEGSTRGHFFIIFKDNNDSLFVLDPQSSMIYDNDEDIIQYLQEFNHNYRILIGQTRDGKFTKFNKLYKQTPLSMKKPTPKRLQKPTLKRLQKPIRRRLNLKTVRQNRDRMKSMRVGRIGGKKGKTNKKRKTRKPNKKRKTRKTRKK